MNSERERIQSMIDKRRAENRRSGDEILDEMERYFPIGSTGKMLLRRRGNLINVKIVRHCRDGGYSGFKTVLENVKTGNWHRIEIKDLMDKMQDFQRS